MAKTSKSTTYTFNLASIPVIAEFRSVKNITLRVYQPDGRVKVTAPLGTSMDKVMKFAASKTQWIEKHRGKFLSEGKNAQAPRSLRNHSIVHVWGDAYELELIERSGNPKIVIDGRQMKMYIRPLSTTAKIQEILDKWYLRILKETAPGIVEKWEGILGVEIKKIYVRKMKTHWGSCNYIRHTMRLNTELVKRDPKDLEYVIVHEMIHIIEHNHDKKFYCLMDKYLPGWKAIRKRMNSGEI